MGEKAAQVTFADVMGCYDGKDYIELASAFVPDEAFQKNCRRSSAVSAAIGATFRLV